MFAQALSPVSGCIAQVRIVNPRVIEMNAQGAPNGGFSAWVPIGIGPNQPAPTPGAFDSVSLSFNKDGRAEIIAWHSLFNTPYRYTQGADGWFRQPQLVF